MPILNYTTKIAVHRSVAEIQRTLSLKGAESVTIEYGLAGKVLSVLFAISLNGGRVQFRLPANASGVLQALRKQRVPARYENIEHAEAVAWRIVKDWIEAQLALVEANQAELAEVFMPYAIVRGQTMFAMLKAQAAQGLLTDGEDAN